MTRLPGPATGRAVCFWSSGKDSAMALAAARRLPELEVVALLTTIHRSPEDGDRVAVHGVPRALVERQAELLGLPLLCVELPSPCPNPVYESALARALEDPLLVGVDTALFGDLFLADIRTYRQELMTRLGLHSVFPLWRRDTAELARQMLAEGIRAYLTVVDTERLPAHFAGRRFDEALLAELPPTVDPCGENGEFHTFVTAGPGWAEAIDVEVGEVSAGERFASCELRSG